jgi:hypothetical protein
MLKNLAELFKEGFLMYSHSQYGDVNWQAKRYEASLVEKKSKNDFKNKKLNIAN